MQNNTIGDLLVDWCVVHENRTKQYGLTRKLGKEISKALDMLKPQYRNFTRIGKLTILRCEQCSYLARYEIYKCRCECGQLLYASLPRLERLNMCATCQTLETSKVRVV